jgi:hypothetical protein
MKFQGPQTGGGGGVTLFYTNRRFANRCLLFKEGTGRECLALSVKCLASGSTAGVRFPTGTWIFSSSPRAIFGPTQAPGLRVSRLKHDAYHAPVSILEVVNAWNFTTSPRIRLYGVILRHRDKGRKWP